MISLNNTYLFLIVLEAGLSPRSRYQQIQCLVKAYFLLRYCLLTISSSRRGEGALWSLIYKGTNPNLVGSTLMNY